MKNKFMNYKKLMQRHIMYLELYNKQVILFHNIKCLKKYICKIKQLDKCHVYN